MASSARCNSVNAIYRVYQKKRSPRFVSNYFSITEAYSTILDLF